MMTMHLHLTMKKGKQPLRGEDYLWSLMMAKHAAGAPFTIRSLFDIASVRMETIREYVLRLERGGFIAKDCSGPRNLYRVAIAQVEAPRVRRDGTVIESAGAAQCMWNAMRNVFRSGFDLIDLMTFASTDEVPISFEMAKAYVGKLAEAGYLVNLQRGSAATTLWRLDPTRNSGPKAPMILRTKMVFDPNKGDIVGPVEAEEVSA